MATLIKADKLCFRVNQQVILDDVSMQVDSGQIVTIIGPNGAGKTTLLRILTRLLKPTSGSVTYQENLRFGYMPQRLDLNDSMPLTVKSFLGFHKASAEVMSFVMDELRITSIIRSSMHTLSGGERQRVLLARAILRQPDILVLDEPVQGVDIDGQNRLYELIDQARSINQCAVLMVSHDLQFVMANTDHVVCLNHHICCEGHPDSVSTNQAYLTLFSDSGAAPAIAHYTHDHDHRHDLSGDVVDSEHGSGCQHDH